MFCDFCGYVLLLGSRQSPEIYNLVFQYHTQPLLDVFEALLLVHFHCGQPVWPMRITPTYFNPAETLQEFNLCNLSSESARTKPKKNTGGKLRAPEGTDCKLCEICVLEFPFCVTQRDKCQCLTLFALDRVVFWTPFSF